MSMHIHAPRATAKRLVAETCPDCGKRTRFIEFFTPWYGWDSTCIRCGRKWADGEWLPLPFVRGARQKNIDTAKGFWRALPPVGLNHYGIGDERY